MSFAAVDPGGGNATSCASRGGSCILYKLCNDNGGTALTNTTGCSQTCCVFPPPPPNSSHICTTNRECPNGEECVRVDADTKICKPKRPGGEGGPLPGGGVNECSRGCTSDEVCVQLSGGRYCLPSCQSIGGSCKASCVSGEISNYGNYCSNNSNRCCTSPSASDLCYSRGGQCKFDDSSASCNADINGFTQYSFPPCDPARYASGFAYPGYACCVKPGGSGGRTPLYDVGGNVFLDSNLNGKKDTGESNYLGAALRLTGSAANIISGTDENGNYKFYGNRAGTYTVRLTVPPNSRNTTAISKSVRLGPSAAGINFGISPVYTISGNIFIDDNGNGIKDSGEVNYTDGGITIRPNSGVASVNQAIGTYLVTGLLAGTYLVSYAAPPIGFKMSAPINGPPPSFSVTVGTACSVVNNDQTGAVCSGSNVINLNFALKRFDAWMQAYGLDIRFDDGYANLIPPTPLYPAYASVVDNLSSSPWSAYSIATGTVKSTSSTGTTIANLNIGVRYKIVIQGEFNLASWLNYDGQWSDNGGPSNCYCHRTSILRFNGNSLTASDVNSTEAKSMHKYTFYFIADSTSLTLRINDSNYTDNSGSLRYDLYVENTVHGLTTTPGIIFTGNGSSTFGNGLSSSTGWVVGGAAGGANYPEEFSQNGIPSATSYQYLFDKAIRAGAIIYDISDACTMPTNCTLPSILTNGIYRANGNVNLNAYTFTKNNNYIFLINGDLKIMGNIQVPNGSTVIFSSSNDIIVDKSVGSSTNSYPLPTGQIQAIFSADRNFIVEGINNCSVAKDKMLNVEGAIVTNAGRETTGTFKNFRDLCGDNVTIPSFTIRQRIDFLLNAPAFISKQNVIFREEN